MEEDSHRISKLVRKWYNKTSIRAMTNMTGEGIMARRETDVIHSPHKNAILDVKEGIDQGHFQVK